MRKWENEEIGKLGASYKLELAEGLLVYSTLAKFKTKTVRKIYKALIFNYVFL